jgi:hypothetical protein
MILGALRIVFHAKYCGETFQKQVRVHLQAPLALKIHPFLAVFIHSIVYSAAFFE